MNCAASLFGFSSGLPINGTLICKHRILFHRFEKYYPPREVFAKEIATLKEHLTGPEIRSPKVFCHNDLLCANILYDKEKGSCRIENCLFFLFLFFAVISR